MLPLASSSWDDAEIGALQSVIESGHFTMGRRVSEFEAAFATFHGARHAIMVNSGSSANLIMLSAINYCQDLRSVVGGEVIVPAVSWSTSYYPINQVGARIRLVDVDTETLNVSVDSVAEAISSETRAILAVNLLGNPAPLEGLASLAQANNLVLLEDNCESLGASIDGQMTGTFGLASTASSYFSHHISTMEGGILLTDYAPLAETAWSLRSHGWTRGLPANNSVHDLSGDDWEDLFRFVLPGYNLRPIEMEGAVGLMQLAKLNAFVQKRRENAAHWKKVMADLRGFRTQREHGTSSWFGFSVLLEDQLAGRRREIVATLAAAGIETRPIVAGNIARNPVMKHLSVVEPAALPGADLIHDSGFFIGNHHYDIRKELDRVAEVLSRF